MSTSIEIVVDTEARTVRVDDAVTSILAEDAKSTGVRQFGPLSETNQTPGWTPTFNNFRTLLLLAVRHHEGGVSWAELKERYGVDKPDRFLASFGLFVEKVEHGTKKRTGFYRLKSNVQVTLRPHFMAACKFIKVPMPRDLLAQPRHRPSWFSSRHEDAALVEPTRTFWIPYVYEGLGIPRDNVSFEIAEQPVQMPDDLRAHVDAISFNNTSDWDGQMFAVDGWKDSRLATDDESRTLRIKLRKHHYRAFAASHRSEAFERKRNEMMAALDPDDMPPAFLNLGLGIALAVWSSDGKLVFVQRSSSVGVRKREWDVAVVEGMRMPADLDLDVFVHRAIWEELRLGHEQVDGWSLLSFGRDCEWNQVNFLGSVRCQLSADDIVTRAKSADDARERRPVVLPVAGDPYSIIEFLIQHSPWSCAVAAAWYALIERFGDDETRRALTRFRGA